ncbi:MBL fold metallo-hydrolase [Kurthia sibirica]|uniref:MBL fold metallo-hydrolase n=1 Tax=Kurthia sibirica TaxID=202750 RepID=A0A2U3ALH7_9BACL|nr:MBL fold metallo-hydrolase [Kurthia sibirica]PWI25362.1 MBL fold metallo-hydrolase [Kurthia sibirica]GEK34622.1 hydrolase [Kurthia sibirica]
MIKGIYTTTPIAGIRTVNCHLIKDEALSIVDVAVRIPSSLEAIKASLKEEGYDVRDVEQIILTHHHLDHIGWTDAFPNAAILGHAYTKKWLSNDPLLNHQYRIFYENLLVEAGVENSEFELPMHLKRSKKATGGRQVTEVLHDGELLPGHPKYHVIETLGHAQSHFVFWQDTTHHLLAGDLLSSEFPSTPLIESPLIDGDERPKYMLQYNESLHRVSKLPVTVTFSGHGPIIPNTAELIEQRLTQYAKKAQQVRALFAKHSPLTVYALAAIIFPKIYTTERGFTISQTWGYIDYLENLGTIRSARVNGVLYYECM